MDNKWKQNNSLNSKAQDNSLNTSQDNKLSSSASKHKYVEPLPESSRPRRDGPGGEDGE
ncbi:hypothetical protein IAI10_14440 [Clostridium sp. 19966]|uniref:hypothetical protein n=1 Tax=Clostridium sp. 19966 TaxID=2768166 RepID=UPI0028DFE557|nr:hypothetical protein [Clostridium sp. 19966]MDT8717864.1 hypothetical protein [Clostridium sp. 19966]